MVIHGKFLILYGESILFVQDHFKSSKCNQTVQLVIVVISWICINYLYCVICSVMPGRWRTWKHREFPCSG